MLIDLTDVEHKDRWRVQEIDGTPIDASAVDWEEGFYEQVLETTRKGRRKSWRRTHRDFDVYDLLNGVLAHRVRRLP